MSKEEKRQLLIEFREYLFKHTRSTASFIYWPDAERFIKALPDEVEKSAEEKAFEAGRTIVGYNPNHKVSEAILKFKTFNDYKTQTP